MAKRTVSHRYLGKCPTCGKIRVISSDKQCYACRCYPNGWEEAIKNRKLRRLHQKK